jgi:hypothetical protein
VAKPNYSFEKRQRELAKKKKKEEKAQRKSGPEAPRDDAHAAPAESYPQITPPGEPPKP